MMILITYDVESRTDAGKRRLRQVAKLCEDHGQRVQFSVFECVLEPLMWVKLKSRLLAVIDAERDSLRFYFLGASWQSHIEHVGAKPTYAPEGPLIL